ncbi:hypothetical protein P1X14_11125 [Sphingomonas sp. AOB5]|uniref:hypothetical protein n=1 Tax=Sphingomonas sp. AOB5 TaxID=3034017 RepID=UPI0023F808F5|nr:hypothetical protein [Sphingomonas sp. AOB5]MDF7775799.1 hypothetical protein [Sphingomonas sp. AOB5]
MYSHDDRHVAVRLFETAATGSQLDPDEINRAVAAGSIEVRNAADYFGVKHWPVVPDDLALPGRPIRELPVIIARYADGQSWLTEVLQEIMAFAAAGRLGTGKYRLEALSAALRDLRAIRDGMRRIRSKAGRAGRAMIRRYTGFRNQPAHPQFSAFEITQMAAPLVSRWAVEVAARPDESPSAIARELLVSSRLILDIEYLEASDTAPAPHIQLLSQDARDRLAALTPRRAIRVQDVLDGR